MDSFFSPEDQALLQEQYGRREVIAYRGVSHGQLSIARHAMGANIGGMPFIYLPDTDELVRRDVYTWLQKRRQDAAQAARAAEIAAATAAQAQFEF